MKKNMMIDIETLGTRPGCMILEMAAVGFDDGDGVADFDVWESGRISLESSTLAGMSMDVETLKWWARKPGFVGMLEGKVEFREAVAGLVGFVGAGLVPKVGRMWCWGTSFDFPIVGDALRRAGFAPPWSYGQEHDARTLCGLLRVRRHGPTEHTALADAIEQSAVVVRALRLLEPFGGFLDKIVN